MRPSELLPSNLRNEVARYLDVLKGGAEHELSRMENEGHVIPRLYHLGEIGHVLPYVDVRSARVAKHQYLRPQVNVHARRLNAPLPQRIDNDTPLSISSRIVRSLSTMRMIPARM